MAERARLGRTGLLVALLGLHFFSRLHGQQVMPLPETHFYPTSYFVALSLMAGRGFNYLLPAAAEVSSAEGGAYAAAVQLVFPPGSDASEPVVGFIGLRGPDAVSRQEFRNFLAGGTRTVPVDGFETTRILDIHLTAFLWQLFGISWTVYFIFQALLSTATNLFVFLITRRLSGSYGCGLAAGLGFLVSPLEAYSFAWSVRDTAPLWFAALAFVVLLWMGEPAPGRRPWARLLGWFAVGAASLLGLGWRPDAQLVPPVILASLVLMLATRGGGWRQVLQAVGCFLLGCLAVRLLIGSLGPGTSFGSVVFHTAWYGEFSRSKAFHTENVFQAARDDDLTLYQANYFARSRFGTGEEAAPARLPHEDRHFRRSRAMYLEMARYDAFTWWTSFPSFLMQSVRIDRPPPPYLGDADQARRFFAERLGGLTSLSQCCLDRYGSSLPFLFALGLLGGLWQPESRLLTAVLASYFVYYAAAMLLVLPEAKHASPLLLPLHVLAAAGWWTAARLFRSLRERKGFRFDLRKHFPLALAAAVIAVGWGLLGAAAYAVSRSQRGRFVESILQAAGKGRDVPESLVGAKSFSVSRSPDDKTVPSGYLLRVRSFRPAALLCLHVRDRTARNRFFAYYTRHPIEPGRDWLFFFNVVSGRDIGDDRPYTAWVRLVGPAEVVGVRKIDLSEWRLGLPLGFVFDEKDAHTGSPFIGAHAPASDQLAGPSAVETFLTQPRILMSN